MNNTLITSDVIVACVGLFGGGLISNVLNTVVHRKQNILEEHKAEYEFLREQNVDSLENIKILKTNVIDPLREELQAYNDKCQTLETNIIELNNQLSDYSQQLENISLWVEQAVQHIEPHWIAKNPIPLKEKRNIL